LTGISPLDVEGLLAALEEAEVRFVVIGGFAVGAHGYPQLIGPDLEYADLDSAAVEDEVFGHRVRFCGFDHLIAMKEAAGRPEDEIDLRRLRESRDA
jgi:hypothetical protein